MPTQSRIAVYLLAVASILAIPSAVQALPIFFRVDSITLQFPSSADENAIVSIGVSRGSLASWVPRASRNGAGSGLSFEPRTRLEVPMLGRALDLQAVI